MFISRSSSFSVVHVNVDIEIKSKERIVFVVVVFISKRPGSYAIYRRNARLLEMQHLIPAYMKGWTVVTDVPSGRKNVLRKLLRILYRRLKAGFSVC